ncbi:MAG: hypothetical protein IPO22_13530 [Anaerolineales bacterium]|nr:hypothetical protein [Anaerolineales bacterium]
MAERKNFQGWFLAQVHLVFSRGKLLNLMLTRNVDDRKPVPRIVRKLFGKLFADKGYISKSLHEELLRTFNVQLVTGIRSNMKNMLMPLMDKILLRKRAIVVNPRSHLSSSALCLLVELVSLRLGGAQVTALATVAGSNHIDRN